MLNNLLKIVSFYLCFLGTQIGLGQTIDVKTQDYNETNGLSAYANFIHKDSRDIIWIGTQFGLYRLDGQEFTHFDEKDGLPFRQIMEIYEDTEGWFWLHKTCFGKPNCQRDLAFFHPLTKDVLTFEERFGDKVSVQAHQVQAIAKDSAQIYFTADKKLGIWSKERGIREVPIKGTKNSPSLWTKVNDAIFGAIDFDVINRAQYFSENIQYLAIDTNGHIHQQFQLPPDIQLTDINRFRTNHFEFEKFRVKNLEIEMASDGNILIDTLDFSLPCCPENEEYYNYDQNLFTDRQGQLFHTDLGLIKEPERKYPTGLSILIDFHLNKKIWLKEKEYPNFFQHFRGEPRHTYFDRETKTAWLALPKGVKSIEYKAQKIKHLNTMDQNRQLAKSAYVVSSYELLLCIEREWFFYNTQTKELKPFLILTNQEYTILHSACGYKIPNKPAFWLINQDPILRNHRLFKINTQNYELTSYPPLTNHSTFWPRRMMQTENRLLLGDREGLTWYHFSGHNIEAFRQYNEFEALKTAKVHFFKEQDEEHFWIGSNAGLYWYSKEEGILARFSDTETRDFYLPAKEFYHMSKAKNGGYWLATTEGLIQWKPTLPAPPAKPFSPREKPSQPKGEQPPTQPTTRNSQPAGGSSPFRGLGGSRGNWQLYTTDSGLSNNEILAAYEDDFGFVWMPTPHGLIQLQISTGLSKTYREGDGLSSKSFQEYAHAQMPDGTLVLGSYNGFNVLHPKDFKDVEFNPDVPLAILDFEQYKANTDQIEYRLNEVIEKGEITLEPGDKFFNIRVALSDYRNADKHRFSYKIEGYQEEWQEDKSNLIRISGLPYGKYILKIKGRLADEQFSKAVLELPIRVLRPFYLKAEFIVFVLLAFAAGMFWFLRWRTRRYQIRQKELEIEIGKATQTIQKQNEELKNLDKIKSRFFANVSHELRTPLTLLLAPIQSVLKNNQLNNKDFTKLTLAKKYGNKLNKMIDEILDLTKLEAGKITLNPTQVVWYNFLRKTVADFESYANQKNIQFTFHYEGNENLQVELDQKKTEIILMNLLSNAFKFTPKNGKVTLDARNEGQYLVIKVSDTGRGIHPNDLPHIFDRFYQTNQPPKGQENVAAEGGTGIGLALTQEFVHLMKGEISVKSDLSKGTEFQVKIPRHEVISQLPTEEAQLLSAFKVSRRDSFGASSKFPKGTPMEQVQNLDSKPHNGQPTTDNGQPIILLVEDNYDLRKFIKNLLETKYRVVEAENGEEALSVLRSRFSVPRSESEQNGEPGTENPELIISDIMMPVMDGYQLLNVIKSDPKTAGIPVIMLTARGGKDDKLKALRIGVDDYMNKPFDEEELFVRIENLLKNAKSRQFAVGSSQLAVTNPEPSDKKQETSIKHQVSKEDREWLSELEKVIKKHLANPDLTIEQIAKEMSVGSRQLARRLKRLVGLSPGQYLKTLRYALARELLENQTHSSVKAVALSVGLRDVVNFSRQFREQFGKLPSAYF